MSGASAFRARSMRWSMPASDVQRERVEHLVVRLLHQGAQERIARFEVVMEHAEVHAGGLGHFAHRHACATSRRIKLAPGCEQRAIEVPGRTRHGRNYTIV